MQDECQTALSITKKGACYKAPFLFIKPDPYLNNHIPF